MEFLSDFSATCGCFSMSDIVDCKPMLHHARQNANTTQSCIAVERRSMQHSWSQPHARAGWSGRCTTSLLGVGSVTVKRTVPCPSIPRSTRDSFSALQISVPRSPTLAAHLARGLPCVPKLEPREFWTRFIRGSPVDDLPPSAASRGTGCAEIGLNWSDCRKDVAFV